MVFYTMRIDTHAEEPLTRAEFSPLPHEDTPKHLAWWVTPVRVTALRALAKAYKFKVKIDVKVRG